MVDGEEVVFPDDEGWQRLRTEGHVGGQPLRAANATFRALEVIRAVVSAPIRGVPPSEREGSRTTVYLLGDIQRSPGQGHDGMPVHPLCDPRVRANADTHG
jgi:hypothetical protein